MTKLSYNQLFVDGKTSNNAFISCRFCKNKTLFVRTVIFENPKVGTRGYKAMANFCNMHKNNKYGIYCKVKLAVPKTKKLHEFIDQRLTLQMACNACKRIQCLYVADFDFENCLYLSWEKFKHRLNIPELKDLQFYKTKPIAGALDEQPAKQRRLISLSLRYRVLTRDNSTCQCCGAKASDGIQLHIDHIKPVSKGGTNSFDNLQTLCKDCNLGKSNKY